MLHDGMIFERVAENSGSTASGGGMKGRMTRLKNFTDE